MLKTEESRWKNNSIKEIIEFNLHQSIRGIHGKIYCVSGANVPRHINSLSWISKQGKYPIVLIERDKDEFKKIERRVRPRKNVTAIYDKALNVDMRDGAYIDLDLMATMTECSTTLSIKLFEQSRSIACKKAFGFTVSLRTCDKPKTFRGINKLMEILEANLIGFDKQKNGWAEPNQIKGNRHEPKFSTKGRIKHMTMYSYSDKKNGGGSPMVTVLIEYI